MDWLHRRVERGVKKVETSNPDPALDEKAAQIADLEKKRIDLDLRLTAVQIETEQQKASKLKADTEEARERANNARFGRQVQKGSFVVAGLLIAAVIVFAVLEGRGDITIEHPDVIFGGTGLFAVVLPFLVALLGRAK